MSGKRTGAKTKNLNVDELLDTWIGPDSNASSTSASSSGKTGGGLGSAKAGLGYTSSKNFNNSNSVTTFGSSRSKISTNVITNIETVSRGEAGLGYSTALEESIIKSNKRKIREEHQEMRNGRQNLNDAVKLHGFIDKYLDDDDEDLGKASILNKKSRIEYKSKPKPVNNVSVKENKSDNGNSNGVSNRNSNSSPMNTNPKNKSIAQGCPGSSNNDGSGEPSTEQASSNAPVGDKKHAWILERKTRTKTRSKQKNIRKDTRTNDAKPVHLQIGSKDYNGRPITKETKANLKLKGQHKI